MSDSLQPHGLQHARRPCPSPTPGARSNSCPSPRWCQASEWLDVNTHTGSWPPVSPAPLSPASPLPPVHSTCVFITPDFFITRKMKKKANPSDNEGIGVQYKLLRSSYFLCRDTIWSVQVPNFLNLRQKWEKNACFQQNIIIVPILSHALKCMSECFLQYPSAGFISHLKL